MAAAISFEVNFKEFERRFGEVRRRFPTQIDIGLRNATRVIRKELKKRTPKQTTKLANSYFILKNAKLDYTVRNDAKTRSGFKYINALEFGTGIFGPKGTPIKPKRKKALAYVDKGRRGNKFLGISRRKPLKGDPKRGGKVFFASVKGIKPVLMFARVRVKAEKIVLTNINLRLRAIVRAINQKNKLGEVQKLISALNQVR